MFVLANMEDMLGLAIPLIALMIPIIAILVRHQQKMAEIMRGDHAEFQGLESLRQEVQDLRQTLNQQVMLIDELREQLATPKLSSEQVSVPPRHESVTS